MLASRDDAGDLATDSGERQSANLSEPLVEYLDPGEQIVVLLSNKRRGLRRESETEATVYSPGDDYRAVAAVTDTRVLFVVGDDGGDEVFSIRYTEIEDVKTARGILTRRLEVWTTEGIQFCFYVRGSDDVAAAAEHVERAAVVWSRVENKTGRARKHLVDVTEALSADDPESARTAHDEARSHLEEARRTATELPTDDPVRERIRDVERRLAETDYRIHRTRARSLSREGERRWQDREYETAYDSYEAAEAEYERAIEVARDHDLPEEPVRERIEEIGRSLEELAASPLRRADRLREWAENTEEPRRAAELFEDALAAYRTALALDWGRDRRFAGDPDRIRETVVRIAGEIEVVRRTLAERARTSGDGHFEAGRYVHARQKYVRARDHLRAALDVAERVAPDLAPGLAEDVAALERAIDRAEEAGADRFRFGGDRN